MEEGKSFVRVGIRVQCAVFLSALLCRRGSISIPIRSKEIEMGSCAVGGSGGKVLPGFIKRAGKILSPLFSLSYRYDI